MILYPLLALFCRHRTFFGAPYMGAPPPPPRCKFSGSASVMSVRCIMYNNIIEPKCDFWVHMKMVWPPWDNKDLLWSIINWMWLVFLDHMLTLRQVRLLHYFTSIMIDCKTFVPWQNVHLTDVLPARDMFWNSLICWSWEGLGILAICFVFKLSCKDSHLHFHCWLWDISGATGTHTN